MARARLRLGVQPVPALDGARLAIELAEARGAEHLRGHVPVRLQQVRCGDHLAQDRA